MNRSPNQLFVVFVLFAAPLMGCGGSPAATQPIVPNDAGQDQASDPDADPPTEAAVDAADAGAEGEADAKIPEAGPDVDQDGDSDPACHHTVCDPCNPDGITCGYLTCLYGFWTDTSTIDSGLANSPCLPPGDAGDADASQDADAPPEAGQDADAGAEAEADAPAEADAQDAGEEPDAGQDADPGYDAPPPPVEICDNGIDDDMNGLKDCADPACVNAPNCQPEVCNGLDDNQDGIVDNGPGMECAFGSTDNCVLANGKHGTRQCQAPDCKYGACQALTEICDDNVDNDLDGKADCADPLCASAPNCQCVSGVYMGDPCNNVPVGTYDCSHTRRCACGLVWGDPNNPAGFYCLQPEICNNGTDDDGDGYKDCLDPDCYGNPVCTEICNDGVDNDGDLLIDCDDPDCAHAGVCQPEVCNGLDDNADGIPDNGPGMECVGTPNNSRACKTACDSDGWQTCDTTTCQWNACQKPSTESRCNDGQDDDCDGYVDCADPDCWSTPACPHTMPTCSPLASGDGLTCTSWVKETVNIPSVWRPFDCCANPGGEQFCLAGNYNTATLIRKTTTTDWAEATLPVPGTAVGGSSILCLGSGQVYMVYNQYDGNGGVNGKGVLAQWNGSSVIELAAGQVTGLVGPMFGKTATDIRFVAYNEHWSNAKIAHWNGSSLTSLPLPSFAPLRILGSKMWGMSMQDLYLVGDLADDVNPDNSRGLIMHYDGTSWVRVATSSDAMSFESITGTSACDVMVTGYLWTTSDQGLVLQKNGNSWETRLYPDFQGIDSAVKSQPSKYLVAASKHGSFGYWGWYGTSNNDGSVTFNPVDPDPLNYHGGHISWQVPGTNTMQMAGEGGSGLWILHATCQ